MSYPQDLPHPLSQIFYWTVGKVWELIHLKKGLKVHIFKKFSAAKFFYTQNNCALMIQWKISMVVCTQLSNWLGRRKSQDQGIAICSRSVQVIVFYNVPFAFPALQRPHVRSRGAIHSHALHHPSVKGLHSDEDSELDLESRTHWVW